MKQSDSVIFCSQMNMGNCVSGDADGSSNNSGQAAAFYAAGPAYAPQATEGYPGPPAAPPVIAAQYAAPMQPEYSQPAYAAPPPPMPPPMPPAYAAPPPAGRAPISDSAYAELVEFLEGTQVMVALDCSGSMKEPVSKKNQRSRTEFMLVYLRRFLAALLEVDLDGLDVYFFGSTIEHVHVQQGNLDQVLARARRNMGGTDTAGVMRRMWQDHNTAAEKTLAIIITDGEPSDTDACFRCIQDLSAKVPNTLAFNFLFLRIGEDESAIAFLQSLDNMVLSEDGQHHDIVDCNTFEAAFADPRGLHKILVLGMTD